MTCPSGSADENGISVWRFVGLAVFVMTWLWAVKGNSEFGAFVDPAGLAIVGVCTMSLLLVVIGGAGMRRALVTLVGGSTTPQEGVAAIFFFRQAEAFALGSGLLATLVGLVVMLQNMSDPSMIGPAIAAALLSLVAAAVIARRHMSDDGLALSGRLERLSVRVAGVAAGAGVVTILLVLVTGLLSMSEIKRDPRFEQVRADWSRPAH